MVTEICDPSDDLPAGFWSNTTDKSKNLNFILIANERLSKQQVFKSSTKLPPAAMLIYSIDCQ